MDLLMKRLKGYIYIDIFCVLVENTPKKKSIPLFMQWRENIRFKPNHEGGKLGIHVLSAAFLKGRASRNKSVYCDSTVK
jgi:hypothetical protein